MNENKINDYDEIYKMTQEGNQQQIYDNMRAESDRTYHEDVMNKANRIMDSMSGTKPIGEPVAPPMEPKTTSEILSMPGSNSEIGSPNVTRTDNLLNSVSDRQKVTRIENPVDVLSRGDSQYVVYGEQSLKKKTVDSDKINSALKKSIAILVALGIAVMGAKVAGTNLHNNDKRTMDATKQYTQYLDETGQRPSEETYENFMDNVYQDNSAVTNSSGGRTN